MVVKYIKFLLVLLLVPSEIWAQGAPDDKMDTPAPDSFLVAFETSKGRFDAMVYREMGPLAVDRFYHLVRLEFFDEVSIFRVVPGYIAQFGIHNEKEVNDAWRKLGIEDEPVKMSNQRGTISFARGGPKTRTTQVFINLRDNSPLDTYRAAGISGYPPFAKIVSGMDVVDSFNGAYRDAPSMRQDSINAMGRAYLDRKFPGLDYIKTVRLIAAF